MKFHQTEFHEKTQQKISPTELHEKNPLSKGFDSFKEWILFNIK